MRFYFLTLISIALISSCSSSTQEVNNNIERNYNEIENYRISWSMIFKQDESDYLLYFYSESCSHCNDIKNEIIDYSFSSSIPFYFVKQSNDFIFKDDIENTIGVTTIEDFFIKGTPTLVEIKDNEVNKNIAGEQKIRDFIS